MVPLEVAPRLLLRQLLPELLLAAPDGHRREPDDVAVLEEAPQLVAHLQEALGGQLEVHREAEDVGPNEVRLGEAVKELLRLRVHLSVTDSRSGCD